MIEGKTIAWDVDDVLAEHVPSFVAYCNKTWNLSMTTDDFSEDWCAMWGVDLDEVNRRSRVFHASNAVLNYPVLPGARRVISAVGERNTNVVATSRREALRPHTARWLEQHFAGLFASVYHSGIFDRETSEDHLLTKADVLVKIGAHYLVDDQPKHCIAAAERGIKAVLFGNYPWNQSVDLPENVTRCKTWNEVEEYFDVAR